MMLAPLLAPMLMPPPPPPSPLDILLPMALLGGVAVLVVSITHPLSNLSRAGIQIASARAPDTRPAGAAKSAVQGAAKVAAKGAAKGARPRAQPRKCKCFHA